MPWQVTSTNWRRHEMLNSRYDDLRSGKVNPISGAEVRARLKAKSDARRVGPFEKRNPRGDLERRSQQAGRMRNHTDQRPVLAAERDADDERGPRLAGHAEIDEPDLTAQRDRHLARRGI